jgi:hypothetical protein
MPTGQGMSSSADACAQEWGDTDDPVAVRDIGSVEVAAEVPTLSGESTKKPRRSTPLCSIAGADDAAVLTVRNVPVPQTDGPACDADEVGVRVVVHRDGRAWVVAEDLLHACFLTSPVRHAFWHTYDTPQERVLLKHDSIAGRPRMVLTRDGLTRFLNSTSRARLSLSRAVLDWIHTRLWPVVFEGKRAEEVISTPTRRHKSPPSRPKRALEVREDDEHAQVPRKHPRTSAPFLDLSTAPSNGGGDVAGAEAESNYQALLQRARRAQREAEAAGEFRAFYVPLEPGDLPTSQLRLIRTFAGPAHGSSLRACDCNGFWFCQDS